MLITTIHPGKYNDVITTKTMKTNNNSFTWCWSYSTQKGRWRVLPIAVESTFALGFWL